MTSLILIGYAIQFITAEAIADLEFHQDNFANGNNARAYGVCGKVSEAIKICAF